jgi:hypothetical protein
MRILIYLHSEQCELLTGVLLITHQLELANTLLRKTAHYLSW